MRVAYISADPGVPVFGRKGASVHVQEVARALRRRQVEVEIFTPRPGGAPASDLDGMEVHLLPSASDAIRMDRERSLMGMNRHIRAALWAAGPFDAVYERYSLWSHSGMEWARGRGVPGVIEVNAPLIDEHERQRGLAHRTAAETVARRAFNAAAAVLAVSQPVARWVMDRCSGPERVSVVPNGVDPDRFSSDRGTGPSDELTVGFVGTLKPWHGTEVLVEAMARLASSEPGWRLLIVGDGPCRGELEAAVAAHGLTSRTTFTGSVSPDEIPALLARIDIAVAPYPDTNECYFSPLKLYEYLAAGLPVVASDVGQIGDVIRHGVTGVLCRPGDATALAAALSDLRRDHHRRAAIGRAGRDLVVRNHTWDQVAVRILASMGMSAQEGRPLVRASV